LQVYFLYLNTDLAFRDRNLRNMLSIYHQTFSLYLSPEEGYMPDQVKPFTLFLMRKSFRIRTNNISTGKFNYYFASY
jgi:hypothetical protein